MNHFSMAPKTLLLLFPAAVVLTACGGDTLDFRNAQIVNGAIYRAGSDKPFSGHVTNVPENTILLGRKDAGPYMRVLAHVYEQLSISGFNPPSFCDVDSDDGVLDSKIVCRGGQNHFLKYEMKFDKGMLDGPFKLYNANKDGSLLAEASYDKGALDGEMKAYGPSTGKVIFHVNWKDGKPEGLEEMFDEKTGKLFARTSYRKGLQDGEVVQYRLGTDRPVHKSTFVEGVKDGVEENYDSWNGKLAERREWKLGKPHGDHVRAKLDDKNAPTDQLEVVARYDNGVELPLNPPPVAAPSVPTVSYADHQVCMDLWVAEFRKEGGKDDDIRRDQMTEWQLWCDAGKRPS